MSVGAIGGATPPSDVQQTVAVKALKLANEQSEAALSLVEDAAATAQAVAEDGSVDVLA